MKGLSRKMNTERGDGVMRGVVGTTSKRVGNVLPELLG